MISNRLWLLALFFSLPLSATPQDASQPTASLQIHTTEGSISNAPLLATDVDFQIAGLIAQVTVTQRFSHQGTAWAEGIYSFPLPENAAVNRLRMKIGERHIEGEIRERRQAQKQYQQAKQSGRRATLVEQQRPNIFTTALANIAPGDSIEVEIQYLQQVDYDNGRFSLRFPMVVAPRYIPGTPIRSERTLSSSMLGWSPITDQVADAPLITPPIALPQEALQRPVRIHLDLKTGIALDRIESPYHPIRVERVTADHARIDLVEPVQAERDFLLNWTFEPSASPRAGLLTDRFMDKDYGLLMLVPPSGIGDDASLPRELTLVLDISGSMHGTSIVQAKASLDRALGQLTAADRFNLIVFNNQTRSLFPTPVDANQRHIAKAQQFIAGLRADGGTEMATAIHRALSQPVAENRVSQVLFITDGAVGNDDALLAMIANQRGPRRLFTVGIGSAPNSFFMRKAAQLGKGSHTPIGSLAEVEHQMDSLLAKLVSPQLADIRIDNPQLEGYPRNIPDLYRGEPLLLSFRGERLPEQLKLTGQLGNQPWQQQLKVSRGADNPAVHTLWGRRKIAALMDDHRTQKAPAEKQQIQQRVTETALSHHLVSRFTSLVAVDKTPARPAGAALDSRMLKTRLPAGWSPQKVVGFAKTATLWQWQLVIGLLLVALGGLFRLRRRQWAH